MPTMKDNLEKAGGLIKTAAAVVAVLPSVAILAGMVHIPPTLGELVRFVCGSIGIVIVLAVILLKDAIRRMSDTVAAVLILGAALGGAVAATGYLRFADSHIIDQPNGDGAPLVLPLHPSQELRALIAPYGEDYAEAIATSIQRERIIALMDSESAISVAIMIVLLVAGQSLIISAIVIGAWKIAEKNPSSAD